MIHMGSLFSGIGGLEIGIGAALAEAGIPHRVVWQVEREPFPRSILARHWPEADRNVIDVCQAGSANLAPVDLICGGFPCQDLSFAGKGAGIAEGTRSGLWYEYRRIVRELRPRFVVVENVAALLSRGLGIVLGDMAALGYDARWECVRASDVGAPHRRERLFIVAYSDARGWGARGGSLGGEAGEHESGHGGGVAYAAVMLGSGGHDHAGSGGEGPGSVPESGDGHGDGRAASDGRSTQSGMGGIAHGLPVRLDRIPERWPAGPGEAQHEWEAPRVAKGIHDRAARLKGLGNAVVPAQGREAMRRLLLPLLRGEQ